MHGFSEDDFVRIPRPRSLIRLLLEVLHIRTKREMDRDRGQTITAVAAVLSSTERAGTVTSRRPGDEWQVSLGAATTADAATVERR